MRQVQIKHFADGEERTTLVDLDLLTPENSKVLAQLPLEQRPLAAAELTRAGRTSAGAAGETRLVRIADGTVSLHPDDPLGYKAGADQSTVQELRAAVDQLHRQLTDLSRTPAAASDSGWESLKLPFLKPIPEKPRQRVVFRRSGVGVLTARYHAAFVRGMLLSLVFDTRYEDAEPFVPESTREDELVEVTVSASPDGEPDQDRVYWVRVYDLHQSLGCLDVINLLIVEGG